MHLQGCKDSAAPSWPPKPWAEVEKEGRPGGQRRSEEHTSELQSQSNLVCRLLLEQKIELHLIEADSVQHDEPRKRAPLPVRFRSGSEASLLPRAHLRPAVPIQRRPDELCVARRLR